VIKLQRYPVPTFLSDEMIKELTAEFESTGKSVWNNDYIKTPLLASSLNKCAYCECPITTQSNYMEVEHFEDKKNYPKKVVAWENLLPSCKKCNGAKSTHDTNSDPIINPYDEDPRVHLSIRLYRLRGKTQKGTSTIEVTNLNHSTRLVMSRFEIGNKMAELIDTAWDRFRSYSISKSVRSKNKLLGLIEGMLEECIPKAPYSASTATTLLTDRNFLDLIQKLRDENLWDAELEILHRSGLSSVLEIT
jgi:uncharacterized protein (TIGR02646 family)